MSYNTLDDWSEVAMPKAIRTHATLPATSGSVQTYLDRASSRVDSYCRAKYGVPFPSGSVPDQVKYAEMVFANYMYVLGEGVPVKVGLEHLKEEYAAVKVDMRDITTGKLLLDQTSDSTPTVYEGRTKIVGTGTKTSFRKFTSSGEEYV